MWGEFPDQTKGRGCEGIGNLRDGNCQGNHSRYPLSGNSTWAISGGKDVALPVPAVAGEVQARAKIKMRDQTDLRKQSQCHTGK